MVLLPLREGENEHSLAGYLAPLRQTLIDNNDRHVNVVCESDYRAQTGHRAFAAASAVASPFFCSVGLHSFAPAVHVCGAWRAGAVRGGALRP
jgi:hypothetical protein